MNAKTYASPAAFKRARPLRRIVEATGVRRETACGRLYMIVAGRLWLLP